MINRHLIVICIILFSTLGSCSDKKQVDALVIMMQIPNQKSTLLLPNKLANELDNSFDIISFSDMDSIQSIDNKTFTRNEFYQKARSLGVQYIVVSSEMIENANHNFPWIVNKNFRICPGKVEHKSDTYYTLLFWDNTKDTYHFFKFLYENE